MSRGCLPTCALCYFDPDPRWWQSEWWRERINIQRRFCVLFGWRLW